MKPINVVHQFKADGTRVSVWLLHDQHTRIEGALLGYDEFMNVVLDDAYEVSTRTGARFPIGRMMLKGDAVGLMHPVATAAAAA